MAVNLKEYLSDLLSLSQANENQRSTLSTMRETPGNLSYAVENALDQHQESLHLRFPTNGIETDLTGQFLPEWINPLNFENNIAQAINALKDVDALMAEYRLHSLSELQRGFVELELDYVYSELDPTIVTKLKSLTTNLRFEEIRNGLQFRISKRLIDLIEYGKAAKLAAQLFWQIELEEMNDIPNDPLSKIREPLRDLLEIRRRIAKRETEPIIPISLKHTKIDNNFIAKWNRSEASDDKRTHKSGLDHYRLEFDLSRFQKFRRQHRLQGLGIRIIDALSDKFAETDAREYDVGVGHWGITLSPEEQRFKFGPASHFHHFIHTKSVLHDVVATRDPSSIKWFQNETQLNMSAATSWEIDISNESDIGREASEIRDIILYFRIAQIGEF